MSAVAIAGIFIVAIAAWGVVRLRRGRAAIQAALEREVEQLEMDAGSRADGRA